MFAMLDKISSKLLGSLKEKESVDKVADCDDEEEFEMIVQEAEYEELIE
jgi:mannitol/fructose-specific phosphotransferase system IIA component (Ntr-type)